MMMIVAEACRLELDVFEDSRDQSNESRQDIDLEFIGFGFLEIIFGESLGGNFTANL